MAHPKDDAPNAPPAAPSAVADIFNSVNNWSLETLGGPGRAADDPFARNSAQGLAQPLAGWSLGGPELLEHAGASAPAPPAEPAGPSPLELYSAHEKSYDSAGKDNLFVDPSSFVLAVRGAPALEAVRANTSSISAASYAKMNLTSGGASVPSNSLPASFGTGDAIVNGGVSATPTSARESIDKKLIAAWTKLWRY